MTDERLSAYLDDETAAAERVSLEADIAASLELQADLATLEQTRLLLRGMGEVEPTPGVFDPQVTSLASHRRRRARWLGSAAAVAGVAAVWLLILGVFSGTGVTSVVPAVDDYLDRHAAAAEGGESDGFTTIGDDDMPDDMPPTLDDLGLAMMGAYERDDTVQAIYSDGEHDLSVYSEPGRVDWKTLGQRGSMDHVGDDTIWHYEADGLSVVVVERRDHVITVVADPGMDEMMMKAAGTQD